MSSEEDVFQYASVFAAGGPDASALIDMFKFMTRLGTGSDLLPRVAWVLQNHHPAGFAKQFFESFLHVDRVHDWADYELAQIAAYQGDPDLAVTSLERLMIDNRLSEEQLLFTATQYARAGKPEIARSILTRVENERSDLVGECQISRQFFDFLQSYGKDIADHLFMQLKNTYLTPTIVEIEQDIRNALENKTPYLLLRLGDGEGSCLKIQDDDAKRYSDLYNSNRKEFLNIWFKDEFLLFDEEFDDVIEQFNHDIAAANCIGGLYQGAIDFEYRLGSRRGIPWVVNSFRKLHQLAEIDRAWARTTSIYSLTIHYELLTSGALHRLLTGRRQLGLISCHEELGRMLSARFGIDNLTFFKVPGEQIHFDVLGSSAVEGVHWPDRYRELLAEIKTGGDRRGQFFLVAAGILGKIYAAELKRAGAVVIDIGAVADLWMGKATRVFPAIDASLTLNLADNC